MIGKLKTLVKKLIMVFKEKQIQPVVLYKNDKEILAGKVALITGGSSGIGLAIAKKFLSSGCKVVIAGTNEDKLRAAVKDIGESSERLAYVVIDIRRVASLAQQIKDAASRFSENKIDILVNSAGRIHQHDFWNIDEQEWDDIIDTNVKGTFFMCRSMGEYMKEHKIRGHILNITSASALRPAWGAYQISKWAVRGMTLGVADLLLPYGIIVNAIAPGPTATPMLSKTDTDNIYNASNPSGRYALPEEIADLAVYLVSGAGDYVVGDTFYITGGGGNISLHR